MKAATFCAVAASVIATVAGSSEAATLSGVVTGDNAFVAYLSTSASELGTPIAEGQTWESPQSLTATLAPGTNYYLQFVVINYSSANTYGSPITPGDLPAGNPDMLVGSFSISGAGFNFENGGTTLDTDTTDWTAYVDPTPSYFGAGYTSAWTTPTDAPVSFGTNGTDIWYALTGAPLPGISSSAQYIWASGVDTGEAFFETELIDPPVPEPASWSLLLFGLASVGGVARLRRYDAVSRVIG